MRTKRVRMLAAISAVLAMVVGSGKTWP